MSIPQPTYLFVTPYLQQMFQQETLRQFVHTYTRLSRTPVLSANPDADVDVWGQPTYTFPPPVPNLPCYYIQRSRPIIQPQGLMSANVPMLYVPFGDPLKRGDWVSNIQTVPDGTTGAIVSIFLGPAEVEDVSPRAPNVDGWIFLQAQLRDVKMVPDGRP
jgi:hypothetical protein